MDGNMTHRRQFRDSQPAGLHFRLFFQPMSKNRPGLSSRARFVLRRAQDERGGVRQAQDEWNTVGPKSKKPFVLSFARPELVEGSKDEHEAISSA
jgi:hypothetical protein